MAKVMEKRKATGSPQHQNNSGDSEQPTAKVYQ
jgi:hypothetical protein